MFILEMTVNKLQVKIPPATAGADRGINREPFGLLVFCLCQTKEKPTFSYHFADEKTEA